MKPLVYLAGPISHTTWKGATNWRVYAREVLAEAGITALDPMRGKDFLNQVVHGNIKFDTMVDSTRQKYAGLEHPLITAHGITKRDRWDVLSSDLILVNFIGAKKVSIGTVMEIAWADAWNKYTIIAMEEDNIHQHGMVNESVGIIVPTFEEALALVPPILTR